MGLIEDIEKFMKSCDLLVVPHVRPHFLELLKRGRILSQ